MIWSYKSWRRKRTLAQAKLDESLWQGVLRSAFYLQALSEAEQTRLKEQVILFLTEKEFQTAHGLALTERMRITIAAQACLLTLNLGLDFYAGWKEIIVYPDQFVPRHEYMDEAGVVHVSRHPLAGEARGDGPVILSWADTQLSYDSDGVNVVIHEFAHKLDMRNGTPNGHPPLHKEMSRERWAQALSAAYREFTARVDAGEETYIDPYAAESPAEFFAVLSEVFFEEPHALIESFPAVYEQFKAFYRQDPAARLTLAVAGYNLPT
jgi:MtfA peptidase